MFLARMVLDVVRLRNHESGRTGSCTSSIESISLTVKGCRFVPRDLLSPASEIRSGRSGPGPKPGGSSPTLPFSFGCVRLLVRSRRLPSGGGVRPFGSLLLSLRRGGQTRDMSPLVVACRLAGRPCSTPALAAHAGPPALRSAGPAGPGRALLGLRNNWSSQDATLNTKTFPCGKLRRTCSSCSTLWANGQVPF
jgi:hypothetical protein